MNVEINIFWLDIVIQNITEGFKFIQCLYLSDLMNLLMTFWDSQYTGKGVEAGHFG